MGCWNGTCAISNLHVKAGQKVAVFLLLKNNEPKTFCYGNALYDLCPVPFYGEYNDYGAVENCHGFGLNMVVEALRSQLYEFGQGPNPYHDPVVNRKNFNLDVLFEADHEDRLGVQHTPLYNSDAYDIRQLEEEKEKNNGLTPEQNFELDRLINKIKKVDTFRQVTHVIVHGDVFDSILEKWYIEEYVGDGKGTKGYGNNYNHLYYKDLIGSIPEYINRVKAAADELEKARLDLQLQVNGAVVDASLLRAYNRAFRTGFEWNDSCMAGRWMEGFKSDSSSTYALIRVYEVVSDYVDAKDWDGLAAFAKEVLTTAWVNCFMSYTRKIWTKQTGAGSQSQEHVGYKVLSNAVLDIIEAERVEYGEDEDEDDELEDLTLSVQSS